MNTRTRTRRLGWAAVMIVGMMTVAACGGGVPGAHYHGHSGPVQKKISLNGCTAYVTHGPSYTETAISGSCPNGVAAVTMDFTTLAWDGKRYWNQCSTFSGKSDYGYAYTVNGGKLAQCSHPYAQAMFLYTTHYVVKPGNLKYYYFI